MNNAGIALGGSLEYLPIEAWRTQLEVNVIGQVAVTQALLPLIRRARGRILFIGSVGGRLGTPLMGPYNASKFALEGFAEAFREELRPWNLKVAGDRTGPSKPTSGIRDASKPAISSKRFRPKHTKDTALSSRVCVG